MNATHKQFDCQNRKKAKIKAKIGINPKNRNLELRMRSLFGIMAHT
jgi:hypothetical protein